MKRFVAAAAFICLLCLSLLSTGTARASTTRVSVGAVIVTGTHRERGGVATTGVAPVPALWVSHRIGRFALYGEAVSSLGPAPVTGGWTHLQSVSLSYLNFVLRYHLSHAMTFGVGETLYNQQSTYYSGFGTISPPPNFVYLVSFTDTERSRVVGARFELRDALHRSTRGRLTALFAVNPHMTANLGSRWSNRLSNGASHTGSQFLEPEVGSQVDAAIENSVRERRYTLRYGLRYVNLLMKFPNGEVALQNALVAPFIGISRSFGH
ncbi:MAG: hypothetical protein ACP5O6_00425 [Candidatus Baltobacteraceae bacterium]